MIELDGNYLEGGGAILRQALALSAITGKPFRIKDIRKGRPEPGLKHQHLYCIKALEEICGANVKGDEIGAASVEFSPSAIHAKDLKVDVKTAGSVTLLMQSLLIPCIFSKQRFSLELIGGTDVAWSQPIDYFKYVLMPQLAKYADVECSLIRRGYHPKGGGKVIINITGKYGLDEDIPKIELLERGRLLEIKGISHASQHLQSNKVAERQRDAALRILQSTNVPIDIKAEYAETYSIGSGITLWASYESKIENPIIIAGDCLGERQKRAEAVGEEAARNLLKEMNACCDKYLADQLIPFMALAKGSAIKASQITKHALSNIYVAERFLDVKFATENKNLIMVRPSPPS